MNKISLKKNRFHVPYKVHGNYGSHLAFDALHIILGYEYISCGQVSLPFNSVASAQPYVAATILSAALSKYLSINTITADSNQTRIVTTNFYESYTDRWFRIFFIPAVIDCQTVTYIFSPIRHTEFFFLSTVILN